MRATYTKSRERPYATYRKAVSVEANKLVKNAQPEMTMNEYQEKVHSTAVYPGQGTPRGLEYCLFGALGELGEIANKYKKILRKEDNVYKHREDLMEESGDVLWYMAEFLRELGYTSEFAAQHNIKKLAARKMAGELKEHK